MISINPVSQFTVRKNVYLGALALVAACSIFVMSSASADSSTDAILQQSCDNYRDAQKLQCERLSYENQENCAVEGFCDSDKQTPQMESYKAETKRLNAG